MKVKNPKHILILEQDTAYARLMEVALQREGYHIMATTSADVAWSLIPRFMPQVILLDMHLADLCGWEFLEHYERFPQPHALIIAMAECQLTVATLRKVSVLLEAPDLQPKLFKTLTSREREVCQLTVDGHTAPDIAQRLCISPRTVEVHCANILRKLNVRTKIELIRYVLQSDLHQ